MKGVWLEDLTSAEVQACFDRGDAVVIPIVSGGPRDRRLPLGSGAMIARAVGQRLIERLPVVMAPVTSFGTLQVQGETSRQMMREMVEAFRTRGVGRIALLDAGPAEEWPVPNGVLLLRLQAAPAMAGELIDRLDSGSAAECEVSMVLAVAPRSVRADASAGAGDPSGPTAFKGERMLAAWGDAAASALVAKWPALDV